MRADIDDSEQWAPVSDLMAALMFIFMLIAVISVVSIVSAESNETNGAPVAEETAEPSEITEQSETFSAECDKIYRELKSEFRNDLPEWRAELDPNLTFRFQDPKVLFASGSAEITARFEEILANFFPRYMRKIRPYHLRENDVREIRIEGHTSSKWRDSTDEKAAYFKNMELSQDRTREILEYVLNLPEASEYDDWARPLITANGLSSSRILDSRGELIHNSGGAEDETLSRRVEFRLLVGVCDNSAEKTS